MWLPAATAAAASDRSCRNEANEVDSELDADEEAADNEEIIGDCDMGASWLFSAPSKGSDGEDTTVMELVIADPHELPAGSASSLSSSSCFSSSYSKTSSLAITGLATPPSPPPRPA